MKRPEQQIHIAVAKHIRARGVPGLVWWHTPNGGKRSKFEAAILKAMGVRAGVSDFIFYRQKQLYCLELKAPGGRLSEGQLEFVSDTDREGAYTAVPEGLDAALATLEAWGLIRPEIRTIGDVAARAAKRLEAAE